MKTISAREFNRDVSAAKREAGQGPVVITERRVPSFVLLSIEHYRGLAGNGAGLVARLSMEDDIDVDFGPVTIGSRVPEL